MRDIPHELDHHGSIRISQHTEKVSELKTEENKVELVQMPQKPISSHKMSPFVMELD